MLNETVNLLPTHRNQLTSLLLGNVPFVSLLHLWLYQQWQRTAGVRVST